MDTSPDGLIRRNQRLREEAAGMVALWNECGNMCVTRKVQALNYGVNRQDTAIGTGYTPDLRVMNTVASESNSVLAAGCVSWITPADSPWFTWKPPFQLEGSDAVTTWLHRCAEIAQYWLQASNFYSKIHEVFLDRSCFGTACLWAEGGMESPVFFRSFDVGSFCLAENSEGRVNSVFRELEYTADQAMEAFPVVPEIVRNDYDRNPTKRHRFLHAVYERDEKERGGPGPSQMRFASCYLHEASKTKCKEEGYEANPAFGTRYLRWSEASVYGASPAMQALAEIRGVNYLEMLVSTMAEVTVNPRIIMPQSMQGVPDLRAGGLTMGGISRDTHPQEWLTGGRIDFGLELIKRKEEMIREIFHRSLFDQFALLDRQITATEVRAREAEKLARFSPAFTLLVTEIINPVLERVFMLLFRAGKFPAPPQEALVRNSMGEMVMMFPQAVQTSRMALALQALKKAAFGSMLELWSPYIVATQSAAVMDNLDEDAAFRDLTRGDGMPSMYLRDSEAVAAYRAARAQAQQAAEQAAQQQEMVQQAMKSQPIAEAGVEAVQKLAA
jgi:hypothetical protein